MRDIDKNIITSFRKEHSKSIDIFLDFLKSKSIEIEGNTLDLGCGAGRNSIFLAKLGLNVFAIDFSTVALEKFHKRVTEEKLTDKIKIYNQSISEKLPFADGFFDFIIDITTFMSLLTQEEIDIYLVETSRVLKPNGYFLLYTLLDSDELYKTFPVENRIITQPNRVKERLYNENELVKIFSEKFKIVFKKEVSGRDIMYGKEYNRKLIVLILQKLNT